MGRSYNADEATRKLADDPLEVTIGKKVYVASVPTIGQQRNIATLLGEKPTDEMGDGEVIDQQLNGITRQLQMLLNEKGKEDAPPPDAALNELPVKIAGEILREINQDKEDEPGNSKS